VNSFIEKYIAHHHHRVSGAFLDECRVTQSRNSHIQSSIRELKSLCVIPCFVKLCCSLLTLQGKLSLETFVIA
jgi:hypothetical protein